MSEMIRSILLPLALLISLGSRSVSGEVPLKAIWALDMNGTRDIYGIDLEEDTKLRGAPAGFEGRREFRENLLRKIQRDLSSKLSDEKARPGFAVASTGLTALNRAKYGIGENNRSGK